MSVHCLGSIILSLEAVHFFVIDINIDEVNSNTLTEQDYAVDVDWLF